MGGGGEGEDREGESNVVGRTSVSLAGMVPGIVLTGSVLGILRPRVLA